MNHFSVFNYENLSEEIMLKFNKTIARNLDPLMNDLKNDEVLGSPALSEFVISAGEYSNAVLVVSDLFHSVSAGIQVGSGNQNLFHRVLLAFTESWGEVIDKQ